MKSGPRDPLQQAGLLLPLVLLPLLLAALFDPVFRATADIDEAWEVGCLVISGVGLALRMLVAGRSPGGLATTGVHSLVRHPLALGNALVWLGLALFPRCGPAVLACAAALWWAYRPAMAAQDHALQRQFGAAFDDWAGRTPAFLPAWSHWTQAAGPFSWRAALLREGRTVFATVATFFLLEVAGDVIVGELPQLEPAWLLLVVLSALPWLGAQLAWGRQAGVSASAALAGQPESPWLVPTVLAGTAACLLAWDFSGADLLLARAMGGAEGFPWKEHWLLTSVLHQGLRDLARVAVGWLALSIAWPTGVLRSLPRRERVWLLATVLLSLLAISAIKHWSHTSCPWDLREFGGVAEHVSHWTWGVLDGGPGHCFPAGHASGGFAFVAGWFALRRRHPAAARAWLAAAVVLGALMGLAQQVRGAHFTSHTLWTAWICWACAWLSATAFLRENGRP